MALINTIPPLTGSVDPLDLHLVQGDGTSVYRLRVGDKGPGRLAWELWASMVLGMVRVEEFDRDAFRVWQETPIKDGSTKTNGRKLDDLRIKHPDLAEQIDEVIAELGS